MEKTRAVAYIRVSTERDAQLHSYEFQEHYWQSAFEDDPNTDLIGIYADKGISGHSVQKRPKFLVMMQDAREHKFDKIYTKSVSRFARNTTQLLEAVRELRDLGIEVVFENENIHTFQPTSEIFLTIAATIAENDLEVDSARQRWSIQHRCENGWISVGSGLFGLKLTTKNTRAMCSWGNRSGTSGNTIRTHTPNMHLATTWKAHTRQSLIEIRGKPHSAYWKNAAETTAGQESHTASPA